MTCNVFSGTLNPAQSSSPLLDVMTARSLGVLWKTCTAVSEGCLLAEVEEHSQTNPGSRGKQALRRRWNPGRDLSERFV